MIQILLRGSNFGECGSNIASISMFKDCNSPTRTLGIWVGLDTDANVGMCYYISNTQVSMYLGENYRQVVLKGWY